MSRKDNLFISPGRVDTYFTMSDYRLADTFRGYSISPANAKYIGPYPEVHFGKHLMLSIPCNPALDLSFMLNPEYWRQVREMADIVSEIHPGMDLFQRPEIHGTSGIPATIVFEGDTNYNRVRIQDISYREDGSYRINKDETLVNLNLLPEELERRNGSVDGNTRRHYQRQVDDLHQTIANLENEKVRVQSEIDQRLATLQEMDVLLSGAFPSVDQSTIRSEPLVYLIQDVAHTGFTKIGVSTNLHNRLPQLTGTKTPLAFDLQIIHVIYTDKPDVLESQLHRQFHNKRRNGEWFALTIEDVQQIVDEHPLV